MGALHEASASMEWHLSYLPACGFVFKIREPHPYQEAECGSLRWICIDSGESDARMCFAAMRCCGVIASLSSTSRTVSR